MDNEKLLLQKGLPSNVEMEKFVLGSIFLRGLECFEECAGVIGRADLVLERHQTIWAGLESLQARGEQIDHATVANELSSSGNLDAAGGLSYLVSLDDGLPIVSNLDSYLRIVKEKANLRRIIAACQSGINRAVSGDERAEDIIASISPAIQSIETDGQEPEWKTATEIIAEHPGGWQAFASPGSSAASGIKLPWPRAQQVVCGLKAGELIILAGRPSMGKSAVALQIAMHAAEQGHPVAYVSLEMTGASLVRREISAEGRVDSARMKLGYLNVHERGKLTNARQRIETLPIYHEAHQRRGRTSSAILASLRYLVARKPVSLVVVDHFHLVDGPEREERIKYNRIADAFQRAARDMGVPFLVLAQLNRKCEEERREPGLADLKECGKLEENADVVMFIHRPEMYPNMRDREDLRGLAKLIIAKQRDGSVGYCDLIFQKEITRFESMASDIEEVQ